jgi:hypothetical protein
VGKSVVLEAFRFSFRLVGSLGASPLSALPCLAFAQITNVTRDTSTPLSAWCMVAGILSGRVQFFPPAKMSRQLRQASSGNPMPLRTEVCASPLV